MTYILSFGFILICAVAPLRAFADPYDPPKVVAVQDRAFWVHHEISINIGTLPLDAFNKSLLGGASYTYSWAPQWSWEVVNFDLADNVQTNLKTQLLQDFNVQPTGVLDHPTGLATTGLYYSPLYGKYILFNEAVVHNELNFGLTGGIMQYLNAGTVPLAGLGFMSRYYYSQGASFKFDARLYYQFTSTQSSSMVLYLTLGYSFHLSANKGHGT